MELLESFDFLSTSLYIVSIYRRSFMQGGLPACDDGFHLLPATVVDCPRPSEADGLLMCDNVAVGEVCRGGEECSTNDEVRNCPGVSHTVFKKTPQKNMLMRSRALFVSALVSATFTGICKMWLKFVWHFETGVVKDVCTWWSIWLLGCPLCCGLTPALLVAFLGPTGVGLAVVISIMVLFEASIIGVNLYYAGGGDMTNENLNRDDYAKLELPFLGACHLWCMAPERATELEGERRPEKICTRFVHDIPEAIIALLDMIWFGVEWYSCADVVFSILVILYYMAASAARAGTRTLQSVRQSTRPSVYGAPSADRWGVLRAVVNLGAMRGARTTTTASTSTAADKE